MLNSFLAQKTVSRFYPRSSHDLLRQVTHICCVLKVMCEISVKFERVDPPRTKVTAF